MAIRLILRASGLSGIRVGTVDDYQGQVLFPECQISAHQSLHTERTHWVLVDILIEFCTPNVLHTKHTHWLLVDSLIEFCTGGEGNLYLNCDLEAALDARDKYMPLVRQPQ